MVSIRKYTPYVVGVTAAKLKTVTIFNTYSQALRLRLGVNKIETSSFTSSSQS